MSSPRPQAIPDKVRRIVQLTAHLSLGEVARELGVDPSYVSMWRGGKPPKRPRPELRGRIEQYLERLENEAKPTRAGAVREPEVRYGKPPDRLAVAIGALEVIRDAADAALRRTRT